MVACEITGDQMRVGMMWIELGHTQKLAGHQIQLRRPRDKNSQIFTATLPAKLHPIYTELILNNVVTALED